MDESKLRDMKPTPESVREIVKMAVMKLGPTVSKEEKIQHAKVLLKIYEHGMLPFEAMEIPPDEIGRIYTFAYALFNSGDYAHARELFKMLCMFNPYQPDYALALGVCHHRLKDYEHAAAVYMLSAILDKNNPLSLFYAYDCFVNMRSDVNGAIMLSNVIARAADNPKYAKLKERAELLLKGLEKQLETKKLQREAQSQEAAGSI